MRSLLGGAKEKLVHDPGAEGPEGEGEAAMTMMVIVYAVALGLFIYGTTPQRTFNARSRLAATAPHIHICCGAARLRRTRLRLRWRRGGLRGYEHPVSVLSDLILS